MNKIVELKIEETKAVVGGNRFETAATFKPPVVGMLPPPSFSAPATLAAW